jgi:hypothetical protein
VTQTHFRAPARTRTLTRIFFFSLAACAATVATASVTISGSPPNTVKVGSAYSFTPTATDSAGLKVSFGITGKPSWATFSSTTGKLSGTPTSANVGAYSGIGISAYDGISTAVKWFGITVQAGSTTPTGGSLTISGSPPYSVNAGSAYSFTPKATDSAGRKVTFSITGKPSWASFSSATGAVSGTPSSANVGKYANIGIVANDGVNTSAVLWFGITVQSSGSTSSTVKISGTPATSATVGSAYKFQPTATDSAGRTLSFSVSNKPSWATFSIASGLLSGTPTSAQAGTYSSIVISASDGTASSALPAFAIKVSTATASTGSATVQWANPTQNTNGTTLMNLAGVHLYYGTSASAMTHEITVASTTQTSYVISGLTAGTWYFGATAYNTSGVQSSMSDIGSKSIN